MQVSRYVDADKDASYVIDHQIKNSSLISKALYRRALARRSMGGKWVTAALNDLGTNLHLLTYSPTHSLTYSLTHSPRFTH